MTYIRRPWGIGFRRHRYARFKWDEEREEESMSEQTPRTSGLIRKNGQSWMDYACEILQSHEAIESELTAAQAAQKKAEGELGEAMKLLGKHLYPDADCVVGDVLELAKDVVAKSEAAEQRAAEMEKERDAVKADLCTLATTVRTGYPPPASHQWTDDDYRKTTVRAAEIATYAERYRFIRSDDLSMNEHKEILDAIEGNADTYLDREIDEMIARNRAALTAREKDNDSQREERNED